jgi:hypothetical protein
MFESATPTVQPAPSFPHGVSGNPVGRKAHLEHLMNKGNTNASHLTGFPLTPCGNDGTGYFKEWMTLESVFRGRPIEYGERGVFDQNRLCLWGGV